MNAMAAAITQEQLLAAVRRLPSLPAVATELILSFEKETVDTDALARKIALDPSLSAATLRLANSSFYGLAGKVATLADAIMVLGLRQLRSLVVTAAVVGRLPVPAGTGFDVDAFWRHSICTALAARQIAEHLKIPAEQAYIAGLLHDIGRLALATCFPELFKEVSAYRTQHDCYLYQAERDVLGLDHSVAGRIMTSHWHFPAAIAEAVACHHAPESEEASSLAGVIHVADILAHGLDMGHGSDDLVPRLSANAWYRLSMDWNELRNHLARIEELQQEVASLLGTP